MSWLGLDSSRYKHRMKGAVPLLLAARIYAAVVGSLCWGVWARDALCAKHVTKSVLRDTV